MEPDNYQLDLMS